MRVDGLISQAAGPGICLMAIHGPRSPVAILLTVRVAAGPYATNGGWV
jgi:hypothetical protein